MIARLIIFSVLATAGLGIESGCLNRRTNISTQSGPSETFIEGVVNAPIAIIPIPFSLARNIVPSKYGIIQTYLDYLPNLSGEIPLNTNVVISGTTSSNFSSVRFTYPFIDLLGNGYSTFRYETDWIVTPQPDIIDASTSFGLRVTVADFRSDTPAAYELVSDPYCRGETSYNGYSRNSTGPYLTSRHCPRSPNDENHYGRQVAFYKNATTQPIFVDGSICANVTRSFDAEMAHNHRFVESEVIIYGDFPAHGKWKKVRGLQVATPFTENYTDCSLLYNL
ncbi:hypothetical protein THAR02_08422 [Trichoderma harzianum]|uniref:Uncharacterized protein n=1 Tax=Trichoderma harzianum TaxID=5544 RepID=A0A0G0A2I7_TRIHA|nr:hypothetical protein THAR02_08422 [Trichoderma harzianum]